MPPRKESPEKPTRTKRRAATTPEDREKQLINAAVDLAERQILDGTASAQVITHFLKLGSTREKLEQEQLAGNVELAKAKIEAMASTMRIEELYGQALEAMQSYQGQTPVMTAGDYEDQDV